MVPKKYTKHTKMASDFSYLACDLKSTVYVSTKSSADARNRLKFSIPCHNVNQRVYLIYKRNQNTIEFDMRFFIICTIW